LGQAGGAVLTPFCLHVRIHEGAGIPQVREGAQQKEDSTHLDPAELLKAIAFAADKHRHQRRKDAEASPYINHPIAVANGLAGEGEMRNRSPLEQSVLVLSTKAVG
jgi:(p)ppGpp synthase/HD superfamily hydrolase